MINYKGIPLKVPYDPKMESPIDIRTIVDKIADLEKLQVRDGFVVACLEDEKLYVKFNGVFKPVGGIDSNNKFNYTFNFRLGNDDNAEDKYLIRNKK